MRARVFVTLKPSVFDPQGKTIVDALHSLGYGGVEDVRQGKVLRARARRRFERQGALDGSSCDKLLANPVSKSRIELAEPLAASSQPAEPQGSRQLAGVGPRTD